MSKSQPIPKLPEAPKAAKAPVPSPDAAELAMTPPEPSDDAAELEIAPPSEMTATNMYFVSTVPRSGSTLLLNLLAQNPKHHCTPTNDVSSLIINVRNAWREMDGFKNQGLEEVRPNILSMFRGMIEGFHASALKAGKIVFDKSRGWWAYAELLDEIMDREVPFLVTVRDVRCVAASFEKIWRQSPSMRQEALGNHELYSQMQTVDGRCRQWLSPGGVLGLSINRLRDCYSRGLGKRLIIIPYRQLTHRPREVLDSVHTQLGLPIYNGYDPNNVKQVVSEDDSIHGLRDLHTIRPKVTPSDAEVNDPKRAPWGKILPPATAKWIEKEFPDINKLAALE